MSELPDNHTDDRVASAGRLASGFLRKLLIGVLLLDLFVITLAALSLQSSLRSHEERAREVAENLTLTLERDIAGSFDIIDLTLQVLADEFGQQLARGSLDQTAWEQRVAKLRAVLPLLNGLRATDAAGNAFFSSDGAATNATNVADRDYFVRLRDDASAGLVVSRPLLGRINNQWSIILARRLNSPDGSFRGAIVASLPLQYFKQRFSGLKLGKQGSIGLRDGSLRLIVRYPDALGEAAKVGATKVADDFTAALQRNRELGSYSSGTTSIDAIQRLHSYRRNSTYDFFINVGFARDDYLSDWWVEFRKTTALVLLFLLSTVIFAWWLRRNLQRQQKAVAKQVESEENFRILTESLPQGVVLTDVEGRILYLNPAFNRLLGYTLEDVPDIGVWWEKAYPDPDYRQKVMGLWHEMVVKPVQVTTATQSFHVCRRDGSSREIEFVVVAMRDGGFLVTFDDVTERQQTEQELLNYRDQLEALVARRTADLEAASQLLQETQFAMDRVGIAIVWIDPESGRLLYANEEAGRQLGYDTRELLERTVADINPELSIKQFRQLPLVDGKGHFDMQHRRKDGSLYPAEVTVYESKRSEVAIFIAFFTDASERRALEQNREQALEAAKRLARVKSEFLANMSHELRTPLNGVLGMAQIGLRESHGRWAQEIFRKIVGSGKLLLSIINDILDFSKIDAGKLKLESLPVDLRQQIGEVLALIEERATERGLRLNSDVAADFPALCLADPLRLEQVLLNLLSNAVKFTETGSVTLDACREDGLIMFRIRDTGIGMSQEQLERIFTPFEQADGSMSRRFGGTGLGLAISSRIVELMGGTIRAQSTLGVGSTFEVRLPLKEVIPAAGRASTLGGSSGAVSGAVLENFAIIGQRLAGLSILVAEDNEVNQFVINDNLLSDGAHVVMVENGLLAVEQVRAQTFDVVLMDIQMPEMNGYEAARIIHEFAPELPIIGQTAHALAEERDNCFAAGMVDHIAKPIDPEQLVAMIRRHVLARSSTND